MGGVTESVVDLGNGLELWRVDIDDAREQDVNARSMPGGMFERLQLTIARDGRLEQLPLLAQVDGHLEVVSGHHRTRAARAGGLKDYWALVDTTGLSPDQIKAKQLAHNSIEGDDEAQLVRRIFDSIRDVDARLDAHIDPKVYVIDQVDRAPMPKLDVDISYRTVLLTFLPHQADRFDKAVGQMLEQADLDRDALFLVDSELGEQWQATMRRLRKEYDARGLSTVVSRMLEATADRLGIDGRAPDDIDPQAWVPISEVLGSALLPPDVAELLGQVKDRLLKSGDVTSRAPWRVLELLCADFLGGPDV